MTMQSKLLNQSIQHWECNLSRARMGLPINNRSDDCPLCHEYRQNSLLSSCAGCPIKQHTNEDWCSKTPYAYASDCEEEFFDEPCNYTHQCYIEAVEEMTLFLRTVRDEGGYDK